jgi:hypothetical protein
MAQHRVTTSALIPAPASKVYSILADYRVGHPSILPRPYFDSLVVEEGGVGAGTAICFEMRVFGRRQTFHSVVTEPEPGRVLVETDLNTGAVTTFTVEPRDDGRNSQVTIATETGARAGILGGLEGWLTTRTLRPIYEKELAQLAVVAAE